MTQAQDFANLSQAYTAGALTFRNKIRNSRFLVNQRGWTSGPTGGVAINPADKWRLAATPTAFPSGTLNIGISASPSAGLALSDYGGLYTNVNTQTAVPSVPSSEYLLWMYQFEAADVCDLLWGTPRAKPVTVSFKAYSTVANLKFAVTLRSGTLDRVYVQPLQFGAANTPTYFRFTVPGDTAGTGWVADSTIGLNMMIVLACADNAKVTPNQWAAGPAGLGYPGMDNLAAAVNNAFAFCDAALEPGTIQTPLECIPYEVDLRYCMRYFYRLNMAATWCKPFPPAMVLSATSAYVACTLPVRMRAAPAVVVANLANTVLTGATVIVSPPTGISPEVYDNEHIAFQLQGAGMVPGQSMLFQHNGTSTPAPYIDFSAE